MKIIAFDVGKARTGVAVSDATGFLASPLCVITRAVPQAIAEQAAAVAAEQGAKTAVFGLPLRTDGKEGETAEFAREVAAIFSQISQIEVVFSDERFSTVIAARNYNEAGKKGAQKRRQTIDAAAAAVILQSYLDHNKR